MFVLAALTPAAVRHRRSGNFCGGTSGYLALLRGLCPRCTYVSLDPACTASAGTRASVPHRGAELRWARRPVTFVGSPSAAIGIEHPVGFTYVDGGKVRFCNGPSTRASRIA